jgi:hypothetical protein
MTFRVRDLMASVSHGKGDPPTEQTQSCTKDTQKICHKEECTKHTRKHEEPGKKDHPDGGCTHEVSCPRCTAPPQTKREAPKKAVSLGLLRSALRQALAQG